MDGRGFFAGRRTDIGVLRIAVFAGLALVATAADATKISIPKTDPQLTINIPDGWTVEYTDVGVEFRSPEKESMILAKIMKRDRPTVNAWTRKVLDRMMAAAGVTVDAAKAAAPPTTVPSETKAAAIPAPAPVQAASAPPMAAQTNPAPASAGQATAKPAQVTSVPPVPVPTAAAPAPATPTSTAASTSASMPKTAPAPTAVASMPPNPPPSVAAPMPAAPPPPSASPKSTNVASMPPAPPPSVAAPVPATPPTLATAAPPPVPMMLAQSSPMSLAPPTSSVPLAAAQQAAAPPVDQPIPGNAATPSFALLGGPQVGGQEPAPKAPQAATKAPQTIHGLHFQVVGYLGGKLKGQPTDIQLVLFDLSSSEVFAVEQQSLPTDNRAVDIISSVTPLRH